MCQICQVIGVHDIKLRPGDTRLEKLIDCELNENQQPIQDKIRKNITYYLGNAIEIRLLSEAAEALFNRDYKGKKQIFVPECFLTKDPRMIYTEKQDLKKLLDSIDNDDLSKKEKGLWQSRLATISGKVSIDKLYGEVSLLEQDTIEAFLKFLTKYN